MATKGKGKGHSKGGRKKGVIDLTLEERRKIEELNRAGMSGRQIAFEIGRNPSTVQKELARGKCEQIVDAKYRKRAMIYDWYHAQNVADTRQTQKTGCPRKVLPKDKQVRLLREYLKQKYSPYAAIQELKMSEGIKKPVCVQTVYSWIHKGQYELSEDLMLRPPKKKDEADKLPEYPSNKAKRPPGYSIDDRPKKVMSRREFGHWEGDLICSPTKSGSSASVFTLLERKSRKYIVFSLPDRKGDSVKKALNRLEELYGDAFEYIFKTITFDNGAEFLDFEKLTHSIRKGRASPRFKIFYAHPYCSGERGSNENANGFFRREYPKGTVFANVDPGEIQNYVSFMNAYPRMILNGKRAEDVFASEVASEKRKQLRIEKKKRVTAA